MCSRMRHTARDKQTAPFLDFGLFLEYGIGGDLETSTAAQNRLSFFTLLLLFFWESVVGGCMGAGYWYGWREGWGYGVFFWVLGVCLGV